MRAFVWTALACATAAATVEETFSGTPRARRGRDLFFDATRGTRCGTCHEASGWGAAIGPNVAGSPIDPRGVVGRRVVRVRLRDGDTFAAYPAEQSELAAKFWDLTSPAPVLRTFLPSEIAGVSPSSDWKHSAGIKSYSNQELEAIAVFLRWLGGGQ